jgi:hypothetical protein
MKVIEAPPLAPAKGGLLSVVPIIETDGAGGILYSGLTYETYLCGGGNLQVPLEGGAMQAPVLSAGATSAGGTFAAGTYYWKVTALSGRGETTGSNEISAVLALNDRKVLNWDPVPRAQGYKVYRGTLAGAQNVLVATLGDVLTYTDTGTAGTAATVPTTSTAGNTPPEDKEFEQQIVIESEPFSLYRGVEDDILVADNSAAEALRAFKAGESYAVEWSLQDRVLNDAAVDLTPTPGTPVTNLRYAVGLLEQYAADHYSGLPLIHGNRLATTLILPELEAGEDGVLRTIHGTPVANGGGYSAQGPDSRDAGSGAWLYITGQVNIWRGPIGEYTAYDLKGNRAYALAEATYVATVECFVAAILVGI